MATSKKNSGGPAVLLLAPVAVAVGAWLLLTRVLRKGNEDEGEAGEKPSHVDADLASPHGEGEFHDAHPDLDDEPSPRGSSSQPEIIPADDSTALDLNGTEEDEAAAAAKARIDVLLKKAAETDEKLSKLVQPNAPKG